MIENIRKYTGLMIVVLVLLFIGLVFMGDGARTAASGKPAMLIAEKQISQKDFRRLSENTLKIPASMPFSPLFGERQKNPLTDLVEVFSPRSTGELLSNANMVLDGASPDRFLANRLAVQKAGIEFGATPGPDEVESFVKTTLFADFEGNFDQTSYDDFIDKRVGRLGIGTKGFNEYIRDLLTAANLSKLISGGLQADAETSKALYRNMRQTISAEQVTLESASYEAEQAPSEEELKAYWEENQENYNTDERRSVSYVFYEPDWDAALVLAEEEKKAADAAKKLQEEAAAKLKEEAKKAEEGNADRLKKEAKKAKDAADKINETITPPAVEGAEGEVGAQGEPAQPSEPTAPVIPDVAAPVIPAEPVVVPAPPKPVIPQLSAKDKLTPAQKQKALDELNPEIAKFYNPLVDLSSGKTFEEHAAELNLKIIKTELFAQDKAPKQLELFATNSPLGQLSAIVFAIAPEGKDDERISEPYSTADGWFVGQLVEVEASRPLTYEEAKVNVTVDLKKKLARKKLLTEAPLIREKLTAALAEGKTFEEAAKAADLKVQKMPNLSVPPRARIPSPSFEVGRYAAPGTIAELSLLPSESDPENALIVFVEKRTVTTDATYETGYEQFVSQQSAGLRLATFQSWLRERYLENDVQYFSQEGQ